MKRSIFSALALAAMAIGPAACSGPDETAEEAEAPANPEAPEGISVTDARMTLPAVGGNPGAVYFTIANDGERDAMIRSAAVQGAGSAMMHETATWNRQTDMQEVFQIPLPAGETVTLEPGGLHVMAMDLDDSLAEGGETEVTITFVGGDKISFPAEIRAPGDGGMDEGGEDN